MALSGVSGVSFAAIVPRVGPGASSGSAAATGDRASRFVASGGVAPADDLLRYERAVRGLGGSVVAGASGLTVPNGGAGPSGSPVAATPLPATVPAPQIGEAVRQAQNLTRFAAAWSDLPGYVAAVISGSVKLPTATTIV